jgi:hypothetical protein
MNCGTEGRNFAPNKPFTYTATIYIAGDLAKIKDVCRAFCLRGLCVTVTPTDFIFTGGSETGAIVGLINYPRFPSTLEEIKKKALLLAKELMSSCFQRSCAVLCTDETIYLQNPNIVIPR